MNNSLAVFAMGLTCGVLSGWGAGCTSHGSYEYVGGGPHAAQGNKQVQASGSSSPFSGNWLCDDSRCESGEVKTVSDHLASIITQSTVHFPKSKPQSVCRVQESDAFVAGTPSTSQVSGSLQSPSYRVLDSVENTHDCSDYYESLNQAQPPSRAVTLALDSGGKTPELSINGIHYRKASDQDLQSLIQAREAQDSKDISIAGTWNCVDDSCDRLIVTITGDLSSMTTYETLRVSSDKQSCRIQEPSKLAITDSSDPDRLVGSVSHGTPSLVIAADNTDGCDDLVKSFDEEPSGNETITLERDGNQILVVNGQRFLRSQEN